MKLRAVGCDKLRCILKLLLHYWYVEEYGTLDDERTRGETEGGDKKRWGGINVKGEIGRVGMNTRVFSTDAQNALDR